MTISQLLCSVYKSSKKAGMYIYVPKADDFSQVPEALMSIFGTPLLVMHVPAKSSHKLFSVSADSLKEAFANDGFYLQMPPQQENWLAEHRIELGLSPQPPKDPK
ncbi:YcgL domain-containing protein [Alteromonas facilis]|uniref:YcgL domain-containing protein n=1 Tax=Alteromonas facilis TaxID=2048004 RepID=UPI00196B6679|nr:YcgL domain-containing protein [Alteromonas facilis]